MATIEKKPIFNLNFLITDGFGNKKNLKLPLQDRQIRCIFSAIVCTFEKHGIKPKNYDGIIQDNVTIQLTPDIVRKNELEMISNDPNGTKAFDGIANPQLGYIRVKVCECIDATITSCLHEYIHLCFPEINDEWRVSTLCQKFKIDVLILYATFNFQYMPHAGILAHRHDHMAHNQHCPTIYNDRENENLEYIITAVNDVCQILSEHKKNNNFKSHINFVK